MNIADQIKSKFNEFSAGSLNGIEGAMVAGDINRKLSSTDMTENEDCEDCDKSETKETTGSGSAGGYSAPLFGETTEACWKGYKQLGVKNKGGKKVPNCVSIKNKDIKENDEVVKTETKETTSSSSSGMYDAPGFEDPKMKGNHKRGSGRSYKKTQIPGGKFVEVKAKCKKFPYCNQGDIKALKIFENKKLQEAIKNVSKKMNVSESVIKNIIAYEYENLKSK